MAKDKVRGRRAKQSEEKKLHQIEKQVLQLEDAVVQAEQVDQQILTPFFGLVDSNELDYFKTAESTLNINAFESVEDRDAFINSVIEESKGKELKLVTNQICSKLFERIILSCNDMQLKNLFKSFNGHFAPLSHHKYASHCIETLLVRSLALVEKELLNPIEDDEEYASMENIFLFMIGELKPYLKEMIQHQYASHVLRIIILILSGRELPSATESNSILRSKKSKIARKMIEIKDNSNLNRKFQIPSSFFDELKSVLELFLQKQDTKSLRELCINAISSPTYSLILSIEGLVLKERPFWDLVFTNTTEKDPKEEAFVEYCLSDAVGSHFLETVLKQARQKNLERIYNLYIKDRVLKIAHREKTGSYIVQVLLTRLKSNELVQPLLDELVAHISELITNKELIKQILDTSKLKNNYNQFAITTLILRSWPRDLSLLESTLKLSHSTCGNTKDDWPTSEERRDLLFLEKLFEFDKVFLERAIEDILAFEGNKTLIDMCKHGVFSHIIEKILVNFDKVDIITRRKLINLFFINNGESNTIVELACHSNGSHIVDKLWLFTTKLNIYKERISESLIANADKVKNSNYGKMVWKNWNIDMYQRRKFDWKKMVKEQELQYFPVEDKKRPSDDQVSVSKKVKV